MKDGVIDRRQFITEVRNTFQLQLWQIALIEAIADGQPEVDPVKHGRWVYGSINGCLHKYCSECMNKVYPCSQCGHGNGLKYCPNCGAKMDEEVCK